jgi:hypothetical protein
MHIFTFLREDDKQIFPHQYTLTNLLYLGVGSYAQSLLWKKNTEEKDKRKNEGRGVL